MKGVGGIQAERRIVSYFTSALEQVASQPDPLAYLARWRPEVWDVLTADEWRTLDVRQWRNEEIGRDAIADAAERLAGASHRL